MKHWPQGNSMSVIRHHRIRVESSSELDFRILLIGEDIEDYKILKNLFDPSIIAARCMRLSRS